MYYCKGDVAVKTISESAKSNAMMIYLNDLEVLSNVGYHPNIVNLIDQSDHVTLFSENGTQINCSSVQVLEALKGGELSYHLSRNGAFRSQTARSFLLQLVSGLDYLHSKTGYIHRDLKPWNIIFSSHLTELKLIDFGLATPIDPE